MTVFENVKSGVRPSPLAFDDKSVWENTDIKEVESVCDGTVFTEYEFNQRRYSKDEYIALLKEQNAGLEAQVTDTQLALCEIYERVM